MLQQLFAQLCASMLLTDMLEIASKDKAFCTLLSTTDTHCGQSLRCGLNGFCNLSSKVLL